MGYLICRARECFGGLWLVSEFPPLWGKRADAILYRTKGEADLIRRRLGRHASIMDASNR
jgi:hypothetical protein